MVYLDSVLDRHTPHRRLNLTTARDSQTNTALQGPDLNENILVVANDSLHILVVRLQAVAQLVLCVIAALHQSVHDALGGRLKFHVVYCIRVGVQPPSCYPLNQLIIWHLQSMHSHGCTGETIILSDPC